MDILAPIDGSDPSERALRFAAELARRFECSLHVVHVTDQETEATDRIIERAREILREEGIEGDPEISIDVDLGFRSADRVGQDILEMVDSEEYDHVVMGHHGTGMVDRAILGSAAQTVVDANTVPVTIIP